MPCAFPGCNREVYSGTDKCIFHAEQKDPQKFRNALAAEIRRLRNEKAELWNFGGFVFVDVLGLDKHPKERYNLFSRSVFPVYVDFKEAKFTRNISFRRATFKENSSFGRSVFNKHAYFSGANFGGSVGFVEAIFESIVDFRSTSFCKDAIFQETTFGTKVDFSASVFSSNAFFMKAAFSGDVFFRKAVFRSCVAFSAVKFNRDAYFQKATVNKKADFRVAIFSGNAVFSKTVFFKSADFRGAEFRGFADFRAVMFHEDVDFRRAVYIGDSHFHKAEFNGKANFSEVSFDGYSSYCEVTFCREVSFLKTTFVVLGDFNRCVIAGNVRWLWPGAGVKLDKDGKEIKRGTLRFKNLTVSEGCSLDFTDNPLAKDAGLIFDSCDMKRVLLRRTDCTKIEFYTNEWPKQGNRFVVFDELRQIEKTRGQKNGEYKKLEVTIPEDKTNYWKEIDVIYQELTNNFRERHNHVLANDFECGIFEMRRRAALASGFAGRANFELINIYKRVSKYSGSILLPLIWLVGSFLVFPVFYFLASKDFPDTSIFSVYGKYFHDSIIIGSYTGSDLKELGSAGTLVEIIKALQRVFTATFVTLFIFAIRRRFKH